MVEASPTSAPRELVLATHNAGKLRELAALLAGLPVRLYSAAQWGIDAPPETGLSFVENALIKARYVSQQSGKGAIADDSGLCVEALDGAPGIHSARYSGLDANDQLNNEKLLRVLEGVPEARRAARFCCVVVLVRHACDPLPLIAQGEWRGVIARAPRGEGGFGYDPLFYLPELNKTAAELAFDLKNRLSHRAQALAELATQMRVALGLGSRQ